MELTAIEILAKEGAFAVAFGSLSWVIVKIVSKFLDMVKDNHQKDIDKEKAKADEYKEQLEVARGLSDRVLDIIAKNSHTNAEIAGAMHSLSHTVESVQQSLSKNTEVLQGIFWVKKADEGDKPSGKSDK